jgi:Cu(I)/Ag(I) efflux system membrane fusion protein
MRGLKLLTIGAVIVAAGAGVAIERYALQGETPWAALTGAKSGEERKILYWVAPMDPTYRRDGPGKSPMGMDLIPVYEGEEPEEPGVVSLPAGVINPIGVRYATVQRETLTPEIRTVGRIAYDEDRTRRIHVRAEGWVERLYVRREGEMVREGDLLLELFAPDLSIATSEYIRELQRGDERGIAVTRRKLRSLGVSERQIAGISPRTGPIDHIQIYAPQDGIIAAIDVAEGMFVAQATRVMTLSDISHVWVLADVVERDIPLVRAGMPARVETTAMPAVAHEGVIDTVFPILREDTRTIELRMKLGNEDGRLNPGALTRVALSGDPVADVLTVPANAVIRLGDGARVVRVIEEGRFEPVTVELGPRIGERMVVRAGLSEGERIVSGAHFLIDSESSLQGGMDRMASHDHHDHGAPAEELVWGDAIVVEVDAERRVVTLDHAPIPALNWPQMVMDFRLADDLDIAHLHEGDEIRFGFVQTRDRRYEIREIAPAKGHQH